MKPVTQPNRPRSSLNPNHQAGERDGLAAVPEPRRSELNLPQRPSMTEVLLIAVSGELDSAETPQVRTLLDQRLDLSRYRRVILDLTNLTLLSSEGVELLVYLHRRSRIGRFALILVGSSRPEVERPLQLTGWLPLFMTRPSLGHAYAGPTRPDWPTITDACNAEPTARSPASGIWCGNQIDRYTGRML